MEQIEIIIIVLLFLAIGFKLIKIFKYFVAIILMLFILKSLGGFEHPAVVDFNEKYKISKTVSEWNEKLGLSGKVQSIFDFFKEDKENKKEDN